MRSDCSCRHHVESWSCIQLQGTTGPWEASCARWILFWWHVWWGHFLSVFPKVVSELRYNISVGPAVILFLNPLLIKKKVKSIQVDNDTTSWSYVTCVETCNSVPPTWNWYKLRIGLCRHLRMPMWHNFLISLYARQQWWLYAFTAYQACKRSKQLLS